MPETMEKRRRWSGYVCPDCRFVFRVPGDHDGQGVVCPECHRLLRIPVSGEALPPLVVPKGSPGEGAGASMVGHHSKKQQRYRRGSHSKTLAWDDEATKTQGSGRGERRQMFWMMVAGVALFSTMVVGVMVAMLGGDEPQAPQSAGPAAVVSSEESGEEQPKAREKTGAVMLAEAEPLIRRFLEATRIEELLPLVSKPTVAEPRMRGKYPGGRIEASGLRAFNTTSAIQRLGTAYAVMVSTRDYEERLVVFFDTPEGIKIDWESWAGWSEMPWEEFLASKPGEAKVFRVNLSPVDYYNFAFSDDAEWCSYRLESPDQEHWVFGYVERESMLDLRLRPPSDKRQVALTLALKFPENATGGNQVLVEKIIADGWVLESEDTP